MNLSPPSDIPTWWTSPLAFRRDEVAGPEVGAVDGLPFDARSAC